MTDSQNSGASSERAESSSGSAGVPGQGMLASGSQYLTFMLAGEEYGIEILRVQEIRGWSKPTPMPCTPSFVRGVINLRGTIVPIIDLRERLGMEAIEYGPSTVVIVLSISGNAQSSVAEGGPGSSDIRDIGLVVDAVSEVYNIKPEQIRDAPELADSDSHFVSGLATMDDKLVILIDADTLVTKEMISGVAQLDIAAIKEAVEGAK